MGRISVHVEPAGAAATFRHYLRDLVYGANDGIITTFAVVAGVAGGALSNSAVLVIGAANLAADGLSMAVGNFLAIRAHEGARAAANLPEEEAYPWKHAVATWIAFVVAGMLPLAPYLSSDHGNEPFLWSGLVAMGSLFSVGAAKCVVTIDNWLIAGLEMLALGSVVGAAAYGAGALVQHLVV
jgi:vacuolar iron transporter family protein